MRENNRAVRDGILHETSRDVTIVMYHAIDPRPHPYAIHPAVFRRHAEMFAARYCVVALRSLTMPDERPHDRRRRLVITFDDAYRDFLEHAYPVLTRLSLPCTMFVPTGFIGETNRWDAATERFVERNIMDQGELHMLARDPSIELGSHSVDHLRMASLAPSEMRHQATASKRALEALGAAVCSFAYPHGQLGDFSADTARVLAGAGYTFGVTTHWGTRLSADPLALRRVHLRDSDDDDAVRAKIEGRSDWIALKERTAFAVRAARSRLRTRIPCMI